MYTALEITGPNLSFSVYSFFQIKVEKFFKLLDVHCFGKFTKPFRTKNVRNGGSGGD